jgi:hypothetical protein
MKKSAQLFFVLMLSVMFLGTYALAAGTSQKGATQGQTQQMGSGGMQGQQGMSGTGGSAAGGKELSEAKEWMDKKVVGQNGEELGTVNNLFVSKEGQVTYVIIEGEDKKLHPVPVNMVQKDPSGQDLKAQFDQQAFQDSPSFSSQELPRLAEQEREQKIRGYYEDKMKSGTQRMGGKGQMKSGGTGTMGGQDQMKSGGTGTMGGQGKSQ